MKIAVYSIICVTAVLFLFVGVLATSSYKRDVKHSADTEPINSTVIVMPDHSRVWRIEPDGYTCFVTSQAKAIWCNQHE